jgi:hypothetical protein
MSNYILEVIELYKEYNFSFDEVDSANFFIDLDYFDLQDIVKKKDLYSMEVLRDYMLIKRGILNVEHQNLFK